MNDEKITISTLKEMKKNNKKITMLTAYDYTAAMLIDRAGIDIILVGDSLAMTVLGYKDTLPVTMDEMVHHTKAVVRGAERALVVADMPFMSFNISCEESVRNAGRLIKEGGAQAVKLEGGGPVVKTVKTLVNAGIPVMAHLGLTPQTASQLGGYKVQGRTSQKARQIMEDARMLQEAGAFSLVLECVPLSLGQEITRELEIPTIGIGAGPYCDGQVLVFHDLVGLFPKFTPKFVKQYYDAGASISKAVQEFRDEVREGRFPSEKHSYS